jgi:hypothetical protein
VRETVDLWKLFPFSEDAQEFSHYKLDHCPSPEHNDQAMSALVFHDGVRCQACGFKASAIDYYLMFHPELSPYTAAVALLSGDFTIEGDLHAPRQQREVRQLDQGLALKHHLALATNADAIAGLEAMGFSKATMRKHHLGYAEVLARLLPSEQELAETTERIEWLERDGKRIPYQRQWRYAVPIYQDSRLRQFIYRKADPADLGAKVQLERAAGTSYLFNVDALKGQKFAILACGWGDALVLDQWQLPAVSGIAGDGHWQDDWAEVLGQFLRCYIVTDADVAGEKLLERVKTKVPWMRPIRLPYPIGTKKDVRDFVLDGHDRDDFLALMWEADKAASWRAIWRAR